MTESTVPLGTPDGGTDGDGDDAGRNRQLMLLLVAALAVAIGVGAWFLLRGGGDEGTPVAAQRHVTAVKHSPTPSASPGATTPSTVPPPANVPVGRNPFKPLVVPADNPTTSVPSATAAPGTPAAPATSTEAQLLKLNAVDPAKQTVSVTLNGKAQSATVNQTFGTYFRLVGVVTGAGGNGAVFQYGDQSIQLNVGDNILIGGTS